MSPHPVRSIGNLEGQQSDSKTNNNAPWAKLASGDFGSAAAIPLWRGKAFSAPCIHTPTAASPPYHHPESTARRQQAKGERSVPSQTSPTAYAVQGHSPHSCSTSRIGSIIDDYELLIQN
ncbi:hypothetical protein I7I51_08711 [Histoplasma capsulatum]|uniref:Uncharacterized protein n=1 Tax=Ajellomyces capsulatus TaxID=5037 RepID=A0A8A1LYL5_AJECA|nr:hypothetical protein I7I51_08711 [Histoplasma capsulatum]